MPPSTTAPRRRSTRKRGTAISQSVEAGGASEGKAEVGADAAVVEDVTMTPRKRSKSDETETAEKKPKVKSETKKKVSTRKVTAKKVAAKKVTQKKVTQKKKKTKAEVGAEASVEAEAAVADDVTKTPRKRSKSDDDGANPASSSSPKSIETETVEKKAKKSEPKKTTPKKKVTPKKVTPKKVTTTTTPKKVTTTKKVTATKKKVTATKKKTKVEPQKITERDELPKLWNGEEAMQKDESYTFKIISWNVAGLRALLRNHPSALPSLATLHDADVICLQETKLQETHVTDPKLKIAGVLLEEEGYDAYYSCSTAKAGYSGTAVFVRRRGGGSAAAVGEKEGKGEGKETKKKGKKKKQGTLGSFFQTTASTSNPEPDEETDAKPAAITATQPKTTGSIDPSDLTPLRTTTELTSSTDPAPVPHTSEGRIITIDFPLFSLTNLYVPNSGQNLERLPYRTESWDTDLLSSMQSKKKNTKTPLIWLGDLNVAHRALDVWNDGAKHLAKQAGVTDAERAAFQRQLDGDGDLEGGEFVDAFRRLHPGARGHYSYWSQRAGNRGVNKGLRLDYFVCSGDLFAGGGEGGRVLVRDSYMLPEVVGSDHCPVVLELEIRKP